MKKVAKRFMKQSTMTSYGSNLTSDDMIASKDEENREELLQGEVTGTLPRKLLIGAELSRRKQEFIDYLLMVTKF